MKLESNYHSMFLLHYHLVLVMKYWRKVFDDTIFTRVRFSSTSRPNTG